MHNKVYTESEAAAQLRMHPSTLAKLARLGHIEFIPGGVGATRQRRLYSREQIDAYKKKAAPVLHDPKETLRAVMTSRSTRSLRGRYSAEALAARGL